MIVVRRFPPVENLPQIDADSPQGTANKLARLGRLT